MIRDLKLFSILDDDTKNEYEVEAIHDDQGYRIIREILADQYNLGNNEPNIEIYNVNIRGDRSLTLRHLQHSRRPLNNDTIEVLKHLRRLWGFDIHLESIHKQQVCAVFHCKEQDEECGCCNRK